MLVRFKQFLKAICRWLFLACLAECAGPGEPLKEGKKTPAKRFYLGIHMQCVFSAELLTNLAPGSGTPLEPPPRGRAADCLPQGGTPPPARFFIMALRGNVLFLWPLSIYAILATGVCAKGERERDIYIYMQSNRGASSSG